MGTAGYVWLECQVINKLSDREVLVEVKLQDGSPAQLKVHPIHLDKLVGATILKVQHKGERTGLTYVELPAPTINYGHNITVKKKQVSFADIPLSKEAKVAKQALKEEEEKKKEQEATRLMAEVRQEKVRAARQAAKKKAAEAKADVKKKTAKKKKSTEEFPEPFQWDDSEK
jgi:hypothetical protein